MAHDRKSVDALLATAASHFLNVAYALNVMRELHNQGRDGEYWGYARAELREHLTVSGSALEEAHRLMLGGLPIFVPEKGGLPN